MNLYQKIAVFTFRFSGAALFFYGTFKVIAFVLNSFSTGTFPYLGFSFNPTMDDANVIFAGYLYLLIGGILFFSGKRIGYIIGKGLND